MSANATPETPWLGLSYFTEEDRGYFFGRAAELRDLFERVVHKPLTVLFGQSGLGKTSLIRAGLVPLLREAGFTPVLVRLDHSETAPPYEEQVLAELRRVPGLPPPALAPPGLWEFFHDPAFGFVTAGGAALARPVLLFDQFEEIFTLGQARRDDALAFRTILSGLVENRIPESVRKAMEDDDDLAERLYVSLRACKVLLSLREDFIHALERWRRVMPSLMDNRLELRLLTGPQALQAVVEPGTLRCAGAPELPPIIGNETGAAIVRFVARAAPDAPMTEIDAVPPLLSLLCAELNAQRGESPVIRSEQLEGRAEDILAQFYERCFAPHPPAVRCFVEDRLLSPEGFRQSANHDAFLHEMRSAGLAAEDVRRILGRLVDDRLLVSEERGGIHRVELTHDILTGMARSSRDARRAREAGEKRRLRRRRLAITVTGLALLAAAISIPLMLWALAEKRQALAEERKGEELLLEASKSDSEESMRKLADGDWNTAIAYGARALRIRPDNAAAIRRLFGQTLLAGMAPSRILAHDGPVTQARFLPDSAALLTVSGGTLRRWEPVGGNRWTSREVFTAGKGEKILALAPAGDRLCLLAPDGSARLWDVSARTAGPALGDAKSSAAVFSPDGSRLLTMSGTAPVVVWNVRSGDKMPSPSSEGDEVTAAALSPDGSRILIGTKTGTIRCWKSTGDGGSWDVEWTLEDALGKGVAGLTISPDGSRFAAVSGDGATTCWSVPTRFQVAALKGEQAASCVAYSGDGSLVATGGTGGSVQLWERASGKPLATLRGHRAAITALDFSDDDRFLLSASEDGTARLWELARCPLDAAEANPGEAASSGEIPPAPGWVYESLLPFLCGKELDREGGILDLPVERQLEAQAIVEQRLETVRSGTGMPATPWDRFLAWKFLSDSRTRPINPDSPLSVPAFVEKSLWKDNQIADERGLRAAWLSAPGHPLAQWALGRTHRGGAWGAWLQDRALRRLADPATSALYGAETAARWGKARAAIDAGESLPGDGFTNSLGMKFAPVAVSSGREVLFCVWETRVRDYAAYAGDRPGVDASWKDLVYKGQKVSPTEDCPVAAVSWEDARQFCEWLTARERKGGTITARQRYRLPTDEEWSWAVGVGEEEEEALRGRSPKDKDSKVGAYPWGTLTYPPLDGEGKPLGNYADSATKKAFPELSAIPGYTDGYATTAPVGMFPAGAHGLYDMGGNVWEWCEDRYDPAENAPAEKKSRVVRGASWGSFGSTYLLSSYRSGDVPGLRSFGFGFRCVLSEDSSAP